MQKIYLKSFLIVQLLGLSFVSYSQIITTIAGNGYAAGSIGGYSGDGGPATMAELNEPQGMISDINGNIYLADCQNKCIREVNIFGTITTFAGCGIQGYSGDGGPATAAELYLPGDITIDALGNFYIADTYNCRIRKINTSGIINTIAGNGHYGFSGDGGPATAAEFNHPWGVAVDISGNVYIADYTNDRIRKVNTLGIITTFAGNGHGSPFNGGYSGDGGPATAAELHFPAAIAFDSYGNIYIADAGNSCIREINTLNIIRSLAGNGTGGYMGDGGPATASELRTPTGVSTDSYGNVYIADNDNNVIREVNTSGTISTIAGNGYGAGIGIGGYSGDGGPATAAELFFPYGIAIDASNNLYVSDGYNQRIREITASIVPLPIILTSFTATYIQQSNSVLTNWVVASQLNNQEFVVEKTLDGTTYKEVARVPGAGTTPFSMSYSAVDNYPTPGISYYRLKQTDVDGHETEFSPVPVFIGNTRNASVNIYPNPVGTNALFIYIATDQNPLTVDIIDITGRVVSSVTLNNVQIGENNFTLNTFNLSKGIYFLRAKESQREYYLKFVKQQ